MEMFVKKLAFLLLFTLLLFAVARLLEFIAWYETGLLMMKLVDPVSLSVKKLKGLLDGRGVSYEGVVDKAELTHLVKASGDVMEGEVLMMEQEAEAEDEEMTTQFSSKTRFDEEVEDKKDSVWLVQVVPRNHGPLLGRNAWSNVVKKLSRFGIRHGTFDCSVDPRICAHKNWNMPLLLLAMPQGHRHKDHVTMATFSSAGKAYPIIKWVNSQLASKVQSDHFRRAAGVIWDHIDSKDPPNRVVLFSRESEPPTFFSALNLKYSGRVKFKFVQVQDDVDSDIFESGYRLRKYPYPSYVIVTPEGRKIYGKKSGEFNTYKALDIYLQTLTPEANDIFVLTFVTVNAICFIGLFVIQGGIAKRVCRFLWTVGKYNVTLLLLWLPLLGIIQLPCLSAVVDYTYKAIRLASDTWLLGKLRQDWLMYSGYSYLLSGSFLVYGMLVHWVCQKCHSPTSEDGMTSAMWLRASMVDFYNFLLRPSPYFANRHPRNDHLEEGLDMLIEQMAVPDFWLHPTFPTDYIKDLLTWHYSCDWLQDRASSNENESSDSEKNIPGCRHHKKKCPEWRSCVEKYHRDLQCSCKLDYGSKEKKDDVLCEAGSDKSNLYVVKSQEGNAVCSQPKSLSPSKNLKDVLPITDDQNQVGRSEACLDNNASGSAEIKPVLSDKNSRCANGKCLADCTQSKRDGTPESQGPHGSCLSPNASEDGACAAIAQRKSSPNCKGHISPRKPKTPRSDSWPEGMLFNAACAICIDSYTHGAVVCGLPCGHAYHRQCIVAWLNNGNHVCPICRWPAYKKKGYKLSKHME